MRKRKLIWHIYPAFLIISLAVLIALTWYASHFFRIFYYNQVASGLEARARVIEHQIEPMISSGSFSEIDNICKALGKTVLTRITIILPDGQVIGDSDEDPAIMKNHSDRPEFKAAVNEGLGRSLRFSDTLNKNMMYLAVPIKQDGKVSAVVRTSVPVTTIDKELANLYKKILWTGIIIVACAAAASWAISKRLSHPIEQMTEVARDFASGDFNHRLSIPNTTELAELAKAFNEMALQLSSRIETITKDKNEIQAILSSMAEGVIAVDSDGNIVSINKAAAEFFGIEAANAIGRIVEEVIRNSEFIEFLQRFLAGKSKTETDIFVDNNGGRFLQLHGTNLLDGRGNSYGAVIVLYDITRIRRLEEVRRDFVANVSHELKTPVTSIKGFVETLLEGASDSPEQAKRFLEIIAKHSDRLNAIIDDLLALSQLEENGEKRRVSFEDTCLRPVLSSAIELSKVKADQKHITVELICDEEITAKINSALIEQAVLNLIDNAVKYSQDSSEVQIDVQRLNNEILIAVRDQGCGIEEQHLSRIFERFYVVDKSRSRKLGGTGLGLSIVKHISQVHGGYVTVESKVNKGSTFTIHLPFDEADADKNA